MFGLRIRGEGRPHPWICHWSMNREWWEGKRERGLFLPFPALLSLPLLLIINSDIPQKVIARDWGRGRCISAVMRKPD